MGRKPNALILEFFERGAKLTDQSNRYEHTCKRCGEVFPKGRPDSLTRHLFEKCPNITDEDRSRALWQPSESSNPSDSELPLLPRREPSGLDALAEVSRQLQANGQHEETLVAQLRQHIDQDNANANVNAPLVQTANAATELAQQLQPMSPAPLNPRKRKADMDPFVNYQSHRPHPQVDPQLQSHDDYSTFVHSLDEEAIQQPQQPPQQYQEPPSFTVNHGGFGLLQRANKTKVRGRFTEERRKEVQIVRKKGACLRCRMLKKPCSEGTPCGTCMNIESARLWKNTCIRSRIADEFSLYSTSLFYAKDHHIVVAALAGVEPMQMPGRIEVTLFPDTQTYATFPALMRPSGCFLLNYKRDPDTLAATLERYLHMAIMQCISREPSSFMRSTLEAATELSVDHNDLLLGKLINLWAATNILISKESIWSVFYEPNQPAVMDAVQGSPDTTAGASSSSDPDKDTSDNRKAFLPESQDYAVICAQLQHAAERYCQKQAKFVMNELERRLLQRQQSSSFLTFLAAVILLNCVERMTGLYHSFIPKPATIDLTSADPIVAPADWPLEDPPANFSHQGESFSNLLHLLLRMRGLPPTTFVRADGTLEVTNDGLNKAYVGDTKHGSGESQLALAVAWVERTGVTLGMLCEARDRDLGKEVDERAWDLRFIAPLLLPVSGFGVGGSGGVGAYPPSVENGALASGLGDGMGGAGPV